MTDARFEDGEDGPLYLAAREEESLGVLSALVQDSVFPVGEMSWQPKTRRFGILLNRFRWEDAPRAKARKRPYERVQSVLLVEDALGVRSQGIDRTKSDLVLSLLALAWRPDADGTGELELTLAGDGLIAVSAECLDVSLRDVTRPYIAPSGKAPDHGD